MITYEYPLNERIRTLLDIVRSLAKEAEKEAAEAQQSLAHVDRRVAEAADDRHKYEHQSQLEAELRGVHESVQVGEQRAADSGKQSGHAEAVSCRVAHTAVGLLTQHVCTLCS